MTARLNITSLAALRLVLLVVISFLCMQFTSVGHAHEADHEAPDDHHICSVCLIAAEADDMPDTDSDDRNNKNSADGFEDNALRTHAPISCETLSSYLFQPDPRGYTRLGKVLPYLASRAPPAWAQQANWLDFAYKYVPPALGFDARQIDAPIAQYISLNVMSLNVRHSLAILNFLDFTGISHVDSTLSIPVSDSSRNKPRPYRSRKLR